MAQSQANTSGSHDEKAQIWKNQFGRDPRRRRPGGGAAPHSFRVLFSRHVRKFYLMPYACRPK